MGFRLIEKTAYIYKMTLLSLIVLVKLDIDIDIVNRIEKLVREGKYSDFKQFLMLAINNQVEEESAETAELKISPNEFSKKQVAERLTGFQNSQTIFNSLSNLGNITIEKSEFHPFVSEVIWHFYNRFFPIKLVTQNLAKMIVVDQKPWIELAEIQTAAFDFAEKLATKLKEVEISEKIPRNKKISTGLPASKLELIALRGMARRKKEDKLQRGRTRFMDQIVGKYNMKDKRFSGACFDLGLMAIKYVDGKCYVSLTELGKEFALFENPILNKNSFESAFSDEEVSFIFRKIYPKFRIEKKIVNQLIEWLKHESLTSSQINELFKKEKRQYFLEERIATMGRLSELQIVNWEIESDGKSKYSLNPEKLNAII